MSVDDYLCLSRRAMTGSKTASEYSPAALLLPVAINRNLAISRTQQ